MQTSTSRGRPTDPRLQERFVRAALDLLATRSYHAVTTAAIAARAGASTASLYRRWPTKQALVADIARTLSLDALGSIDTGSLTGDLREFVGRKRQLLEHVGTVLLSLLAEAGQDDELRGILRHEVVDATILHLGTVLDRAVARGEIPAPPAGVVRVLGTGLVGGELLLRALPPGPSPAPDGSATEAEVAMLARALGAPSAPAP